MFHVEHSHILSFSDDIRPDSKSFRRQLSLTAIRSRIKLISGNQRSKMEIPNAFIGQASQPTADELSAALGASVVVWQELVDWFAEQKVVVQEWNSYSPKAGWSLRLKVKKRNIVHLAPCSSCFRVAFIFGDKAIAAARQSNLAKSTLKLLDEAPRYPEGTGLRMTVKSTRDLVEIRKLALIKLAN